MGTTYDLVIRGGTVVDGTGGAPFDADVAIRDGKIVDVGAVEGKGREEIDARGLIVAPGFVDIHTHYDGQVTWEERTEPSASHGVTTAVMGNCGVGFAPCRPEDRKRLTNLMEGVEDIPEVVMDAGLPWSWETFPEYMDFVASRHRDIDVAAQLPHAALRVYVMGQRALDLEAANADDLAKMRELSEQAIRAGAIGFATSRSLFHRDRDGRQIPTRQAEEAELFAIADGIRAAGRGVVEALVDFRDLDSEFELLRRTAERAGCPLSFTVLQTLDDPDAWRRALKLVASANDDGLDIRGQVMCRPTGMLLGLDLSFNPFSLRPTYQSIADLPLAERVAKMRDPEIRRRILGEQAADSSVLVLKFLERFDWMFELGNPPVYDPPVEHSIGARAARAGVEPQEIAYDLLLEEEGKGILFITIANYIDGNLDPILSMLRDPNTVVGLGDGGAHYGMICDAGYPTFLLTYWTRDRTDGERLSLPEAIRALSYDCAKAVGLDDRGRVAAGLKADLNLIDYDRLKLHAPRTARDLPSGGRRLRQAADGFRATIVSGEVVYRDGVHTGALPGRLVRSKPA